jgi:hypothetical protein
LIFQIKRTFKMNQNIILNTKINISNNTRVSTHFMHNVVDGGSGSMSFVYVPVCFCVSKMLMKKIKIFLFFYLLQVNLFLYFQIIFICRYQK